MASTLEFPECVLSRTGQTPRPALQWKRVRPAFSQVAGRGRQAASLLRAGPEKKPGPQAWSRAQLTVIRSPQGRPVLWLRENAGFCPLGRQLSFLRTCWEAPPWEENLRKLGGGGCCWLGPAGRREEVQMPTTSTGKLEEKILTLS